MSRTLKLVDRLLARGRHFQRLGRPQDALHILTRLTGFRELAPTVAEEAQARLAEIQLGRKKYARARRHLTAALTHSPQSARYHYLMASALAGDPRADRQRAADHYRESLRIEPDQPRCLGEFGRLAIELGREDEGLGCLRRAVELAPADPAALSRLVEGLVMLARDDEARDVLRAALFRNPRDPRFRRLYTDFQFQRLREEQRRQRHPAAAGDDEEEGPVLLPFRRPDPGSVPARRSARRHAPSLPQGPHTTRPARLPDQRYAQ